MIRSNAIKPRRTRRAVRAASVLASVGIMSSMLSGCFLHAANNYIPAASPGTIKHYDSLDGVPITVGSKDFTEQLIFGNMLAIIFNVAGADVTNKTGLPGSNTARNAEIKGDVDIQLEYTGTGWISYLGHTKPIPDRIKQWKAVAKEDLAKNRLVWLKPAPMNNTYAMAIRAAEGKKLGVTKMSDLKALSTKDLTFCVESEFASRDDGFEPMLETYGMKLGGDVPKGNVKTLDTGIIYTATAKGTCNFGEVFTTDGRIKALNLTVMADDKKFFPLYNVAPVVGEDLLKAHPEIQQILAPVMAKITTETMQTLNAKVDVDGEEPALVARDWLRDQGFVS